MRKQSILCAMLAMLSLVSEARELGHYVPGVANIRDLANRLSY